MRNLKRNTKKLWYSNYTENVPILDENGDETGDYDNGYSSPTFFYASLSAKRMDKQISKARRNTGFSFSPA